MTRILFILTTAFCLLSCGGDRKPIAHGNKMANTTTPIDVECICLVPEEFAEEIISNGVLHASRRADVKWEASSVVSKVLVKNGVHVRCGQLLAELNHDRESLGLKQCQDNLLRARLEMQDYLIGQGYALSDTANIPPAVRDVARVRSGLQQAEIAYAMARLTLKSTNLYAPIDGVVVNLSDCENNHVTAGELFCSILDRSSMRVDFPLVQNELSVAKVGSPVVVSLLGASDNVTARGTIRTINPIIEDEGTITASATLNNLPKGWIDGMKVNVSVRHGVRSQCVIPKSAVTHRDGRQVVFSYKNGLALWNYVKLGAENTTLVVVEEGLKFGDSVIIRGNEHLAHLTPVRIEKPVR